MRLRELAAFLVLAAVWGGSFLFIRVAVPALGTFPLVAGRVLLAGLVLTVAVAVRRQRVDLRRWAPGLLVVGALNAAIPFALISAAELVLPASLASVLNATVPLFTAVLSAAFLRERLAPRRIAGLLLGVVGVAVLVGWSPIALTTPTALGVLAMLLAACCYGAAGVYTKRRLAGAPASTLALGQQIAAGAWLLVPALVRLPHAHPTPTALAALAGLAVLSTALAYPLYFYLIARIGPTKTASVTYVVPVFGMTWGALLLGEPVTTGMLAGFLCIVASMALVTGLWSGRLSMPARVPLDVTR